MKMSKVEAMATLMALAVAVSTMTIPVFADSSSAATPLAFVNVPWIQVTNSSASYVSLVYQNQSPGVMNGTMYAVFHNSIGQTVEIASEPINSVAAGQNATVTFVVTGPFDVYLVDVFAVNAGGWAISATTNSTVVA